jgi:predicted AAA+ superfamily ATPase
LIGLWLLGIVDASAMNIHPMRGALFENMLVTEYLKYCRNFGVAHAMYFWRDNIGNEVDLLIERAGELWPVEMKSGATFNSHWLSGLHTWARHAAQARQGRGMLISAAPGSFEQQGVVAVNWRSALEALAVAPG